MGERGRYGRDREREGGGKKGGDIESQTDSGKVVARWTKSKSEAIEIVSKRERERPSDKTSGTDSKFLRQTGKKKTRE